MEGQERPCRVCGGRLDSVLNLGNLALPAFPLPGERFAAVAPLDFCQCPACALVQLRHTVDPELLFRQYWYQSGINETMRAELADVARSAMAWVGGLSAGDCVIDIGANDGTLLNQLAIPDVTRVAFEPARNLNTALHQHADLVVADYFPQGLQQLTRLPSAKVICSIACFYDLDDPGTFVQAITQCLAPDGVWVVQFQDLDQMIRATAFDNICHEHLVYYSLASVERLIEPYGLHVTHAERRAINGGSYRLFIQVDTVRADETVGALRFAEAGCEHWHALERFAWRVGEARRQIQSALTAVEGTIDLYGASTKGNTLLQYCGLDGGVIRQAWERSEAKWGRLTATGIPIVSEAEGRRDPPDLLLVGVWQFREAILRREVAYLQQGGAMLFPLPAVDLVKGGPLEGVPGYDH